MTMNKYPVVEKVVIIVTNSNKIFHQCTLSTINNSALTAMHNTKLYIGASQNSPQFRAIN